MNIQSKQELKEVIEQFISSSKLNDADKKEFITFTMQLPEEEMVQIVNIFTTHPQEIENFWITYKTKSHVINIVKNAENINQKRKEKLIDQIDMMSNDEFHAFIEGVQTVTSKPNEARNIYNSLMNNYTKTHETFMKTSKELLHHINTTHDDIQNEKDQQSYNSVLNAINN